MSGSGIECSICGGRHLAKDCDDARPGSEHAIELGCRCPRIDNHYGKGVETRIAANRIRRSFWVNADCPIHGDSR